MKKLINMNNTALIIITPTLKYIILKKNISKFDSIETKEEPKDAAPEEAKPEEAKPEEKPAEETPAKEPEETEEKEQAREDTIQVTQKIYKKNTT